jgi:membrane-bound lytic murein transglycosylase
VSSSIRPAALAVLIASLGACATSPERTGTPSAAPGQPQGEFSLQPAAFDALPGWSSADLAPALTAFRRQCESWRARAPDTLTQGGRDGGPIGAWLPACNGADTVAPGGERSFFEANFTAARVAGAGEARLTAYFEPVIEARRSVQPGFDAPLLKPPSDMVTVDLEAFAAAYDSDALRGTPRALTGRINGKKVENPILRARPSRPRQGRRLRGPIAPISTICRSKVRAACGSTTEPKYVRSSAHRTAIAGAQRSARCATKAGSPARPGLASANGSMRIPRT